MSEYIPRMKARNFQFGASLASHSEAATGVATLKCFHRQGRVEYHPRQRDGRNSREANFGGTAQRRSVDRVLAGVEGSRARRNWTIGPRARRSFIAIARAKPSAPKANLVRPPTTSSPGTVDISINNPLAHLRTQPAFGFFGRSVARMKSFLVNDGQDKRAEAHERKFIGIDANIDLPMNKPIAQLGPGELFGEMTCRTFQPRSATVIDAGAMRDGGNAARDSRHAGRQPPGLRRFQGDVESQSADVQRHFVQSGAGEKISRAFARNPSPQRSAFRIGRRRFHRLSEREG